MNAANVRRAGARMAFPAAFLLVLLLALADARTGIGPDVHRADADCRRCHTADAAALRADSAAARVALVPDLDARCMACHGAEGPSHRTGMRLKRAAPALLPLSRDGLVTCGTCHLVHGERVKAEAFERIDNHRGQLCLSCHTMSELQ